MNMHTVKRTTAISALLILLITSMVSALSPEQVISKLEENLLYPSSRSEGRIIINDRFGERKSSYVSYTSGKDNSMVEFTGKEEAGQKILRLDNELYLYYPDAEELIRLQGAALKQSVIGSDMSYEDMAGDKSILDSYRVSLEGEETVNGKACYKVQLEAKSRDIPYQNQIFWIDKETFLYVKIVQLAKSGKELKEITVKKTMEAEGHIIPVDMIIRDMLKKNSSTEFIVDDFEINPDIPEGTFNLQGLW